MPAEKGKQRRRSPEDVGSQPNPLNYPEVVPESIVTTPAPPQPDFIPINVRMTKDTYNALARLSYLLRKKGDDKGVAELIMQAIEAYVPVLVAQQDALQRAILLNSVFTQQA